MIWCVVSLRAYQVRGRGAVRLAVGGGGGGGSTHKADTARCAVPLYPELCCRGAERLLSLPNQVIWHFENVCT